MPKHGFLTPKAIGNRIKAKGLQKLRWYCEMCQKQCRDENGFKCHTMSESHQRQLLIVAENPNQFVNKFSQDFLDTFIYLLSRRFGTRRVLANTVYKEYISERNHLHMNATQWTTLTEFVKFLGKEGHCLVDETPKGWFIQYIDRDPETLARQEAQEKERRHQLSEEQRAAKAIEDQIARDRAAFAEGDGEEEEDERGALDGEEGEQNGDVHLSGPLSLKKSLPVGPQTSSLLESREVPKAFEENEDTPTFKKMELGSKRKISALQEIMDSDAKKKQADEDAWLRKKEKEQLEDKLHRKDYWLYEGLVVKVVNKELADGKYYKAKGIVKEVIDKYVARVNILDSKTVLKIDQEYLETVLPGLGGRLLVVNGRHRGYEATLLEIHVDDFCADVKLEEGPAKGSTVFDIPYEDICKIERA